MAAPGNRNPGYVPPDYDITNPNDPRNPHSRLGAGRGRVQGSFRSGEVVGGEIESGDELTDSMRDYGDEDDGPTSGRRRR